MTTTPVWQAATPGYPTYAGQINQFLVAHPSLLYYAGAVASGCVDPSSLSVPSVSDTVSQAALAQAFTVSSATTLTYVYLALKNINAGCDLLVTIQPGNNGFPAGTTTTTSVGGCGAIVPAEWMSTANPALPLSSSPNLVPIGFYPQPTLTAGVTYYVVVTPYANCVPSVDDVLWGRSSAGQTGTAYRYSTSGVWSTTGSTPFAAFFRTGNSGALTGVIEDQGTLVKAYGRNNIGEISSSYEWSYAQANPNILCRDDAGFTKSVGTWSATNAAIGPTSNSTTVSTPSTTAVVATPTTVASSPSSTAVVSSTTTNGTGAQTTATNTLSTTAAVSLTTTATPGSTTPTFASTTFASTSAALNTTGSVTVTASATITGFPTGAGAFRIYTAYSGGSYAYVTYTSVSGSTFVGCNVVAAQSTVALPFTPTSGNPIIVATASTNSTGTSQSTITVGSTTGFPTPGAAPASVTVLHGGSYYVVSYTGTTATTLTGCTCSTLFTLTTGDSIFPGYMQGSSNPGNLTVSSTTSFISTGTVAIVTAGGTFTVTYAGTTTTAFQNAYSTSGTAFAYLGTNSIITNYLSTTPSNLVVGSVSGFPTSGNFTVGTTLVSYTGTSGTAQFTGCTIASGTYTVPATTAVNNGVLSTSVASNFTLASVTSLPTSGTVNLVHSATNYTITYTGITGNSLTGCTASTAVTATNGDAVSSNFLSTLASQMFVASTTGFPASGVVNVIHSGTNYVVTYTSLLSTAFVGCTIASGTAQLSNSDNVNFNVLTTVGSTLIVANNTGFQTSGNFVLTHSGTRYVVTYTGTSGTTQFLGCSISTGTVVTTTGDTVISGQLSSAYSSNLVLASGTGFAASGTFYFIHSSTLYRGTYTSVSGNVLVGCTITNPTGTVTLTTGDIVATEVLSTSASTLTVASTTGFETAGTVNLVHSSVAYTVTYTGTTSTTFTGCTISSGTVVVSNGDAVSMDVISTTPTTVAAASNALFPSSGNFVATHSSTQYTVAYTGLSAFANLNNTFATLTGTTTGIVTDSSGNIYVATTNNVIAKITSTGTVTSVWASLTSGASTTGIAIDSSGNIYTANSGNNTVSKITSAGVVTTSWASVPGGPQFITVDSSSNVWVSTATTGAIVKINSSGTVVATYNVGGTSAGPYGMVTDSGGNLYSANYNNSTISKITPAGVVTAAWATLPSNSGPFSLAIDSSGNLYSANFTSGTISIISSNGSASTFATLNAGLDIIVRDSSGNFYVSNATYQQIYRVSPTGVNTGVWAQLPYTATGFFITVDTSGNVYSSNGTISTISKGIPQYEFNGCTLSTGAVSLSNGDAITVANILTSTPSTLTVVSTTGFPTSGVVSLVHGGITYIVTYTSITSVQFLNSTIVTGSVTATAGDVVSQGTTSAVVVGGSNALLITVATAATASVYTFSGLTAYPAQASTAYTLSSYFQAATTGRTITPTAVFFDSSGTQISSSSGSSITDTTTGWTRSTYSFTTPANTAYIQFQYAISSPAAGEAHYMSNVQFNAGSIVPWVYPGAGVASNRSLSYFNTTLGFPALSVVT
jgi:streptogramin lyase